MAEAPEFAETRPGCCWSADYWHPTPVRAQSWRLGRSFAGA